MRILRHQRLSGRIQGTQCAPGVREPQPAAFQADAIETSHIPADILPELPATTNTPGWWMSPGVL